MLIVVQHQFADLSLAKLPPLAAVHVLVLPKKCRALNVGIDHGGICNIDLTVAVDIGARQYMLVRDQTGASDVGVDL